MTLKFASRVSNLDLCWDSADCFFQFVQFIKPFRVLLLLLCYFRYPCFGDFLFVLLRHVIHVVLIGSLYSTSSRPRPSRMMSSAR